MQGLKRLTRSSISASSSQILRSNENNKTLHLLPPSQYFLAQRTSNRFFEFYKLANKAAVEKEKARLADELNRGYFADMNELKKHGGKISEANKILFPAMAAVKFPDLEVSYTDGKILKLPFRPSGNENVADANVPALPKASLLCLSFRASAQEYSEHCVKTIRNSWAEIDKVASKSHGLSILSKRFSTCKKVKRASDLKDYLDERYADIAQYEPDLAGIFCKAIDAAPIKTDILDKIIAGFEILKWNGSKPCHDIEENDSFEGWRWQTCSEMVMPISHGNQSDSMYPPELFDLDSFVKQCKKLYGVSPQPHWITTYYGGHDLKSILHRFGSNIIFSNGLRDPWSCGGVLKDISDSVVAISTVKGSHCLDLSPADPSDPQWLVQQRHTEVKIIEGWIAKYHSDHQAINKTSPASREKERDYKSTRL